MDATGSRFDRSTAEGSKQLFGDGLVLPEQLARPVRFVHCGSGRLMKAVLEDGVDCFLSQNRSLRDEAAIWIFADESGRLFSFRGVCEALGIDPEALRAHLAERAIRPSGVAA